MCQTAVLDEEGALLDEVRFRNDEKGVMDFALKLSTFRDKMKTVVARATMVFLSLPAPNSFIEDTNPTIKISVYEDDEDIGISQRANS